METRFWQPLKDKGLVVAAIDANGDAMDGLQAYLTHIPQTYPVGLEDPSTKTYAAFTAIYKGLNPFPVDIIVDKTGIVRYVGREYDPATMTTMINKLLAE
jgi:hypothetical protein